MQKNLQNVRCSVLSVTRRKRAYKALQSMVQNPGIAVKSGTVAAIVAGRPIPCGYGSSVVMAAATRKPNAQVSSMVRSRFRTADSASSILVLGTINAGEAQVNVRALGMGEVAGLRPASGTTARGWPIG